MQNGIAFVKMHGAGNDYVYVDCFYQYVKNPGAFARRVSDRHFGIGSDGAVFIKPSKRADCFMDIYNADGSRGKTCGNGLRCTARYLWEKLGGEKKEITIETLAGIHTAVVESEKSWVRVDMGKPYCRDLFVPKNAVNKMLPPGVFIDWAQVVDAGNMHCVLMLKSYRDQELSEEVLANMKIKAIGAYLENYPDFPASVNVEFCLPGSTGVKEAHCNILRARVWERGSGETLACGSGACAIYRAWQENCKRSGGTDALCVFMPGGRLYVEENSQGQTLLSGEAVKVFSGVI